MHTKALWSVPITRTVKAGSSQDSCRCCSETFLTVRSDPKDDSCPLRCVGNFSFIMTTLCFSTYSPKKKKKNFLPERPKTQKTHKMKSLSHIPQFSLLFCLSCFDLMRLLGLVLTSHSEYRQNQSGISVWRWCCPVWHAGVSPRSFISHARVKMGLNLFGVHSAPCMSNDLKTGRSTNLQYEIPRAWLETLELEPKCFSRLSDWQILSHWLLFSPRYVQSVNSQQFALFNQ